MGLTTPNLQVNFEKGEGAVITLTGKSIGYVNGVNFVTSDSD